MRTAPVDGVRSTLRNFRLGGLAERVKATPVNNKYYLIISWYLHVRNGVAVAAYIRLASQSHAKFQNNQIESHSGFHAHPHLRRARYPAVVH